MQPSRVRYRVVALAIGLAVLSYVQRVAISQAAGPISKDLHFNKEAMGLVFGAFGLSYAIFELPMGLLGDRLGVRRVLIQIVLAWSLFTALTGAAWNLISMYVIRFAFGAGEAGCFPNLTRMLSVWLPARERVRAQSLMWACTRWGGAATPPVVLAIVSLFGWRWAFVAFALLGVIWCIVFFVWFRNDPAEDPCVNTEELALIETARNLPVHHGAQQNWLSILLTTQVAVLVLQYFCFSFVWYFYITWLPTYLREARAQTPGHAATLSMLPLLLGGFGSLLSGLIPIRVPRRWVAFCGFIGAGTLLFTLTRVQAVFPAMLCMGMASFCSDLTMPISWNAWRGDWRQVYGDRCGDNEYARQPGGICGAGGWRHDSATHRRPLEFADLPDGGRIGDLSSMLAVPRSGHAKYQSFPNLGKNPDGCRR